MIRNYLKELHQRSHVFALAVDCTRHTLLCIRHLRWPWEMHQAWGTTGYDRHPRVFKAIQAIVADAPIDSVLSFGCSFGDEAYTLVDYFPKVRIFGADINKERLKVAQTRNSCRKVIFFLSTPENLRSYGPFDVIIAKSVFLRHPEDTHVKNLRWLYPFKTFENGIRQIFDNLKPEGLLVIYNANYRVMDTCLRNRLQVVPSDIVQSEDVPLFGTDGKRLQVGVYREQVFRRIA